MKQNRLPILVKRLLAVVKELETIYQGRHFTLDGHLVGSIGECLAAHHYGLKLCKASTPGCDAMRGKRRIEVKATFRSRIALRCAAEHLLVLKLDDGGDFEAVYNGPGDLVWSEFRGKKTPSNGQQQVSLRRLRVLMDDVPTGKRLRRIR